MIRYFCCRLTPSGIGDQLSQLNRLHDLGRCFGLEYLYREPPRNRWSPDFDAADFLGLGLGEQRLADFPDHTLVTVDGSAALHALREGRPLDALLPAPRPQRIVVEFAHSDSMYARGTAVELRHPIDLRAKLAARHGATVLERGRRGEVAVCLHVRQGDCTWVQARNRFVFLGMRKIASDPRDVDVRRAPSADDYAPLLADIGARLAGRPWTLTVYSDGPANVFPPRPGPAGKLLYEIALREPRVLDWLRLARQRHALHALYNPMCDAAIVHAYEQVRTSLQRLVAPYPGAQLRVGTSRALTEAAILDFATADVAVLGRSRMAFPLLGLGDAAHQAAVLLNRTREQNLAELDRALPRFRSLE